MIFPSWGISRRWNFSTKKRSFLQGACRAGKWAARQQQLRNTRCMQAGYWWACSVVHVYRYICSQPSVFCSRRDTTSNLINTACIYIICVCLRICVNHLSFRVIIYYFPGYFVDHIFCIFELRTHVGMVGHKTYFWLSKLERTIAIYRASVPVCENRGARALAPPQ